MSARWNNVCKLMVWIKHGSKWTDSRKSATKMQDLSRAYEVMTALSHRSQ